MSRKPDAEARLVAFVKCYGATMEQWASGRDDMQWAWRGFRRRLRALLRERAEMAQAAAVRSTGSIPLKRAPNDREWANFVLPIRAAILGRKRGPAMKRTLLRRVGRHAT